MEQNTKLIYETKRLMLSRYPRFGSEIARANIEYRKNLKYHTAATDGQNIYFDPDYLISLSEDDRLFLTAHELMHIKFAHAFRLIGKDGQKRDSDTWNEATDAIINANLERDGFKIKEGYVNRPEALNYSAEEFYQMLLQEKQNRQQNNQNGQNGEEGNQGKSNENDNQQQDGNETKKQHSGDDHSLWEEAFDKRQEQQNDEKSQSQNDGKQEQQPTQSESNNSEVDESSEFEKNRQERKVRAEENLQRMREQMLRNSGENINNEAMNLGNVGESNNSIDWRLLLRREIEKSETIWSQNRSIAENNYAYRLEENDIEDEAETEVMIDVSGSVDLDMVRAFLRMLKPLLKESKLRVGCFNEKYWGMTEIKSVHDIDNFIIPKDARGHSAWTEDWDLAVRSFTKKKEINKIVFTDGEPCPGTMPKEDLKHENILWLVYGNRDFRPCCGKIINITEEQLKMMQSCQFDSESKGRLR
jgi:predicted metal-dependent peptidase